MGSATFFKPDDYFADAPWRQRSRAAGPILLNMIHEVHNLRLLCGEIVAVQAFASHATRGFAVEDTIAINLRFAKRRTRQLHALRHRRLRAQLGTDLAGKQGLHELTTDEDCYVITGTSGSLSVPTMRLKTYPRPEDRSWWKPFEEGVVGMVRDDPLKHQIEHFGAVVRGEAEPPCVGARWAEESARHRSDCRSGAKSGRVIELPSD